jgi:hypothetical protein
MMSPFRRMVPITVSTSACAEEKLAVVGPVALHLDFGTASHSSYGILGSWVVYDEDTKGNILSGTVLDWYSGDR